MSEQHSTVSLLPLHYDGHQVRVSVDHEGNIWWVAQDVCDILDNGHPANLLRDFPDDEKGKYRIQTPGGLQAMLTVNEPGLYRLIFCSRKPDANAVKRWVFHDVLPTLRRTGTYTVPVSPEALTPTGMLPPPVARIREHAEVSWHLAAVWTLLRTSGEVLTNQEIARRTGIARRTARAHTRYLLGLGLLDLHETFPRHLYEVAAVAQQRNPGCYQRLTYLASVIEARQVF